MSEGTFRPPIQIGCGYCAQKGQDVRATVFPDTAGNIPYGGRCVRCAQWSWFLAKVEVWEAPFPSYTGQVN